MFRIESTSAVATTQKVNKEAVRLLVVQHGQREAARLAGLNEDTVCSWAKRYGWSIASKPQANGHSPLVERVASELETLERETRSSLARSAAKLAKRSESADLEQSGHVHNVAKTAAIVHRWDAKTDQSQNVIVNVALLGIAPSEVATTARIVDSEGQGIGE